VEVSRMWEARFSRLKEDSLGLQDPENRKLESRSPPALSFLGHRKTQEQKKRAA
jgi:hypothetical protein